MRNSGKKARGCFKVSSDSSMVLPTNLTKLPLPLSQDLATLSFASTRRCWLVCRLALITPCTSISCFRCRRWKVRTSLTTLCGLWKPTPHGACRTRLSLRHRRLCALLEIPLTLFCHGWTSSIQDATIWKPVSISIKSTPIGGSAGLRKLLVRWSNGTVLSSSTPANVTCPLFS